LILYLDTSALVKLLIREVRSDEALATFDAAEFAATSEITYAEACAALARNDRRRGSSRRQLEGELEALDRFWREFSKVQVLTKKAGQIALSHSLRGMDAIQLAAALTLRDGLRACDIDALVVFATFDHELSDAAEREGFATLGGDIR